METNTQETNTMNTTTNITITDIREADEVRVFTPTEFKMDKRTREYKNLAELTKTVGEYYTITTGYYANPDYPLNEWTSKYFMLELKDEAAATDLLNQALELGLFTYGMDNKQAIAIPAKTVIYADSSDILSHHDTLIEMVAAADGFVPSESVWENRSKMEYGTVATLAKIQAAITMRQLEEAQKAAREQEFAAAEAALPLTHEMERAAKRATIQAETLRANSGENTATLARDYKRVAVNIAVAIMCEQFAALCGTVKKDYEGTFRRVTVAEAFGHVVSRACNDSYICPTELFGEAVNEFRSAVSFY